MNRADIGVIGLAVMGQNLVLNMEEHGAFVAVYNRTTARVDEFIANQAKGKKIIGTHSIREFVQQLARPRKILLMIKAGSAVDDCIQELCKYLQAGDLIIDGGNSNYVDTNRRARQLKAKNLLFIGAGISGGEEGARFGPSIMPGGDIQAWPLVKELFQAISAKVDGKSCCEWVGEAGAGHFVKMVHNGIEYGDLELIGEAYMIMRDLLQLDHDEMANIFAEWNRKELSSYLVEITSKVLAKKENQEPLVEKILDVAGQKGTGKWTIMSALDLSVPITLISEAVFMRALSELRSERELAVKKYRREKSEPIKDKKGIIEDLFYALYAAKIISYSQGYLLMREASKAFHWNLDFASIALLWRGGCIIRSQFLGKINEAFSRNSHLASLLLDDFFAHELSRSDAAWRRIVSLSALNRIPISALSSALSFYDGYLSDRLPTNLIQGLRDYFGAHSYERVDRPRGQFFHTQWNSSSSGP